MGSLGDFAAGAAVAVALASLGPPAVAETVNMTCNLERTLTGFGGQNRPNDRYAWRFAVDTDAPSVTWVSGSERMNQPTGGNWLLGRAAAAVRMNDGGLMACLIDTGVCGETISTDYYDETVSAANFSPDLRRVRMTMTQRAADGTRTSEFFSGSCS
jgi:hypothetical protein